MLKGCSFIQSGYSLFIIIRPSRSLSPKKKKNPRYNFQSCLRGIQLVHCMATWYHSWFCSFWDSKCAISSYFSWINRTQRNFIPNECIRLILNINRWIKVPLTIESIHLNWAPRELSNENHWIHQWHRPPWFYNTIYNFDTIAMHS